VARTRNEAERVEELERSLLRPAVRGSAEALEALLAPEFLEFGGSGRVYDRRQIVEALLADPGTEEIEAGAHAFATRLLADGVVLLTYRTRRVDPVGGERYDVLRSSIWRRDGETWRLVFHQATPARPA
jgi:hypothetical protein